MILVILLLLRLGRVKGRNGRLDWVFIGRDFCVLGFFDQNEVVGLQLGDEVEDRVGFWLGVGQGWCECEVMYLEIIVCVVWKQFVYVGQWYVLYVWVVWVVYGEVVLDDGVVGFEL